MAQPRLESNVATQEELNRSLVDLGFEPDEAQARGRDFEPSKLDRKEPEPEGKPGEKPAAEPDGKSAAEPDKANPEKQDTPPGEPEGEKQKTKGGYQRKIDGLTSRVDALREELEEERGDKTRLREKLEAAQSELEEFRGKATPAGEKKEQGPKRPKRPEMPELAKLDYDTNKYEQAMREYRKEEDKFFDELDTYNASVAEQKAKDAIADADKRREEQVREAQANQVEAEAFSRLDKGRKGIEDWDDVFESVPKDAKMALDKSAAAQGYIKYDSSDPARLYHFFFKDYLENDSVEGERIAKLSPARQVVELAKIEDRLIAEHKGTKVEEPPKKEEPKAEAKPAQEPPAKPKAQPSKVPDDPIDPVGGSRAAANNTGDLYKQIAAAISAKDYKERRRLEALLEEREAVTAGRRA